MGNRKAVTLCKYVKVGTQWRYARVVVNKNYSFSSEMVWVKKGVQERHPEGSFYLSWWDGEKKRPEFRCIGKDLSRIEGLTTLPVNIHQAIRILELRLLEQQAVETREEPPATEKDFQAAIALYLEDLQTGNRQGLKPKRPATVSLFRQTLMEFASGEWNGGRGGWTTFPSMPEMRRDILKYREWLEKKGLERHTIGKKIDRLNQCIRTELKLDRGHGPVKRSDFDQWGYFDDDGKVEIYTDEQIKKFFDVCSGEEHLLFSVLYESGFRAQEVANLTWRKVDFIHDELMVNREGGFQPKNRNSVRRVKVGTLLTSRLKAWKETSTSEYVFTHEGKRLTNDYILRLCKDIGERAGMSRQEFKTHKWRHTHATAFLRNSASAAHALKKLMARLGHKDLKTTERYLGFLPDEEEQQILDKIAIVPAEARQDTSLVQ